MKINSKIKNLFTKFPSQWEPGKFQIIHFAYIEEDEFPEDDEDYKIEYEIAASADSLKGLWQNFAENTTKSLEVDLTKAAEMVLSGEDTGFFYMCQDESLLEFLKSIDDKAVMLAAFDCLANNDISFRKPGKALVVSYPDWEFLFSWNARQEDDTFWVVKKVN